MSMIKQTARNHLTVAIMEESEKHAILQAMDAGKQFGYVNLITWLQTALAEELCEEGESVAGAVTIATGISVFMPPLFRFINEQHEADAMPGLKIKDT
ncbi:MAG TPA: hypothetical protein VF077_13115 [Nitrospiraceae bacterium]